MSYLVLARKWRPQTFGQVVGQDHVTRTLQNAIKQQRLAHAIIFSGARGVGKTSIARIVAKAINCEKGPRSEPCNQCTICQEITKGACVDVLEIDGASNRGIDEIRHLRENIVFQPVQCRFKVYIIDEVHMLTREAFNALLKTLEEPPRHVYFIFATTEASKIPETIRSRCQHYEFRLLTPSEISNHLTQICKQDNLGLEPSAIDLVSRAAQGSIRDSLSLLDQVVAFGAHTVEEVHEALGLIPSQVVSGLAEAVLGGRVKDAILAVDNVVRYGGDLKRLAQDLLFFLRDLLLLKEIGEGAKDLYINPIRDLESFDKKVLDGYVLKEAIELLARAMDPIARSNTPRLLLETTIIRICQINEIIKIDQIIERLDSINVAPPQDLAEARPPAFTKYGPEDSRGPNRDTHSSAATSGYRHDLRHEDRGTPTHHDAVEEATPPSTTSPDLGRTNAQGFLSYLMNRLEGDNNPIFHYIHGLQGVDLTDNGTVQLVCGNTFLEKRLQDRAIKEKLAYHAKAYFGRDLKIEVLCSNGALKSEEAGHGPAKRQIPNQLSQQEELKKHPLVQEAIKVFGARVENVEIFRS